MARKRRAQEAPAKDGTFFVTYTGEQDSVQYMGRVFARGVPVPVEESDLDVFRRSFFEVSRGDV